jgi:hypothetical protein
MAAPAIRAHQRPPASLPHPQESQDKRITNRAQTKVAFRLPRKHDTSNP